MKAIFSYTGIRVKDIEESIWFYSKLLNLKVKRRGKIKETGGEFVVLEDETTKQKLELNYYPVSSKFYTPYLNGEELDHLVFSFEDLDSALEELKKAGFHVHTEIRSK